MMFYLYSFLLLFLGVVVISARQIMYSILAFIFLVCNMVGFLLFLGVDFLALSLMIIYVGAIAVLFLFVIMMLNFRLALVYNYIYNLYTFVGLCLFLVLSAIVIAFPETFVFDNKMVLFENLSISWAEQVDMATNIEVLGLILFGYYYYLFYFAAFLLLVAMIGSIILTLEVSFVRRVPKVEKQILSQTTLNLKQ